MYMDRMLETHTHPETSAALFYHNGLSLKKKKAKKKKGRIIQK